MQRRTRVQAHSEQRRKMLSAPLSKELAKKYGTKSVTVRKDDRVRFRAGDDDKEGKVTDVFRRKMVIHVEGYTRVNNRTKREVKIGVDPSKVQVVGLKMDKDRKAKLEAKKQAGKGADAAGDAMEQDRVD